MATQSQLDIYKTALIMHRSGTQEGVAMLLDAHRESVEKAKDALYAAMQQVEAAYIAKTTSEADIRKHILRLGGGPALVGASGLQAPKEYVPKVDDVVLYGGHTAIVTEVFPNTAKVEFVYNGKSRTPRHSALTHFDLYNGGMQGVEAVL